MLDVLDLYSESATLLTAEDVAARLQVSRTTAFRYMRELSSAGILANYSGRYSLGARLITLDYRIRASDPILQEAREIMRVLCAETACSALLCRMYNEEIIHVHHEAGPDEHGLAVIGRGRPLPLFRGSASKTMLAYLPANKLRKIYDRHHDDPDLQALATDWPSFKAYFAKIRQVGYYLSNQEIDTGTVGIAAPVTVGRLGPVAVISLVFSVHRLPMLNPDGLCAILRTRTQELGRKLESLAVEA